jgi:phage terminase large subunit GpA-like protein
MYRELLEKRTKVTCPLWVLVVQKPARAGVSAFHRGGASVSCWFWLCPHCDHQRLSAHDVHHAGEVVGEYV